MDLSDYRKEIDRIDRKIIRLLEERFDVVSDVGRYKQRKGIPVLDSEREARKLEALADLVSEHKKPYVEKLLKAIMEQSRAWQSDHMARFGLLGRVLGHSHSPRVHRMLRGYEYALFEREPERLDSFFKEESWQGVSVTIPYKRTVMKYCDTLSARAKEFGSVNTIARFPDGTLLGDNTDAYGLQYLIESEGADPKGKKALVLGSGGAGGMAAQVLRNMGADPVIIISRSGDDNYNNLDRHQDAGLLINATPVGMMPNEGTAPVNIGSFPNLEAVFDLIYNPLRTKLVLDARAAGVPAFGGLKMLVAQAAEAGRIFAKAEDAEESYEPSDALISSVCEELQRGLQHIVLIGMPGAGKTTVGEKLAELTGRPFLDVDREIERACGRTPGEIILSDGEDAFRRVETEIMRRLFRESQTARAGGFCGMVIAAGGGCVERAENRDLIMENAAVVWLKRPTEELSAEDRPVSQRDGAEAILRRRQSTYLAWSDIQIDCGGLDPLQTARAIAEQLGYEMVEIPEI